jgi:hypothetical protein
MIKNVIKRISGISPIRLVEKPASGDVRLARTRILELVPKGTVGAELGVFKGSFSTIILEVVQPMRLYLVDPWWVEYGEYYPNWGAYTNGGQLRTKEAYEQAVVSVQSVSSACEVKFCVERSADWLSSLEDEHLDWAYLDSTHEYADTIKELGLLARKVKRSGLILGDDWQLERTHMHHGVFKAIQEFSRKEPFEIIRADEHLQWALRRTN